MPAQSTLRTSQLERIQILQDIVARIDALDGQVDGTINFQYLKNDVLLPVIDGNFNPDTQIRGVLKAICKTRVFKDTYNSIADPKVKTQIDEFIGGKSSAEASCGDSFHLLSCPSPGAKHHFSLLDAIKSVFLEVTDARTDIQKLLLFASTHASDLPIIYEDAQKTKIMEVYSDVPFENWGQTVKNTPRLTFLPTTVHGVKEIVRYAAKRNLRVRCGGYRHSWSSIFGENGHIFISFVNLTTVTTLPDPICIQGEPPVQPVVPELKTIELLEPHLTEPDKRLCRVGTAVTNEDFRRWAVKHNAWSLPVDVVLVEVTIGGVNGPICHGAGRQHKNISDYVRRVEYVDCNGDSRLVHDPRLIKAAAGAFGLLGVVTHITFELDAMTYAIMEPRKVDVGLAIPPLSPNDIPAAIRSDWLQAPDADAQTIAAIEDFEKRAENDYYAEWFWFPYQRKVWINTWNTTTDSTGVVEYPDEGETFLHWISGWAGGILTQLDFFNILPGYCQAQLMATMGMAALPPTSGETELMTIKTALPNALHFRRGVQNMRVQDLEYQIPIPARKDDPDRPDFDIVRRAWWDAIKLVYDFSGDKEDPSSPMRLTLEMRIMGGSDMTMAPQRGNHWGTASIEVLTLPDTIVDGEWVKFLQRLSDIWMSYEDQNGNTLNVRPHWAKEWEGLTMKGMDAAEYLRTVAFKDQIAEFRKMLAKIGKPYGWGLDELEKRFSNELWDKMVYGK